MNTNINEVVGLLRLKDPGTLEKLRKEFSNYPDLLKPGITLGTEETEETNPEEVLIRGKVCLSGLVLVLNICEKSLPALKKRLKNLGNIQFVSQVIVALSGAALLTQNQATFPQIKIVIGTLALMGSIFTLYAQHKSGTILNNSESIFSYYDKLVDSKFEAESLRQEIDIELQIFDRNRSLGNLSNKIDKGNNVCMNIRKILDKI